MKVRGAADCTELITSNTAYESQFLLPNECNQLASKIKTWSFGTINTQSGKEKDEGAKI